MYLTTTLVQAKVILRHLIYKTAHLPLLLLLLLPLTLICHVSWAICPYNQPRGICKDGELWAWERKTYLLITVVVVSVKMMKTKRKIFLGILSQVYHPTWEIAREFLIPRNGEVLSTCLPPLPRRRCRQQLFKNDNNRWSVTTTVHQFLALTSLCWQNRRNP